MAFAKAAVWGGRPSGEIEGLVLVDSKYGTLLRAAPLRGKRNRRVKSPLQLANEARMTRASQAFRGLDFERAREWGRYGETLAEAHPRTGVVAALSGQQAFNRLASKLLQIDPQADLPEGPPSAPFFGDGVRIAVQSAGRSGVLFRADAPSRAGVLAELLLQPLASANRRTYLDRYRSQAFATFAPDARDVLVPAKAGWQAAAVRFVEASTGRVTALVELGVVRVE